MTPPPLISCQHLSRHYQLGGETIKALDDLSFRAEAGEFLALAGPSGSGKSTLLHLIGALDTPTAGKVFLDGVDISTLSRTQQAALRRKDIGFVFQAYNLIPVLTAMENVEYVMLLQGVEKSERRRRSLEVLEEVGLGNVPDRFPTQFSGGQQQRVAVARAIAGKPKLVLADEPTANLDSVTAEGLMTLLEALNQKHGISFIFSTHDALVMSRAKRLVRLRDGRVESDTWKTE